ncbi:hypothetical protein C1N51_27700 (plasmid) [Vibrio campbellii]|nr:hypothetical protein C1N51_27700 [Vibrio campbellii]
MLKVKSKRPHRKDLITMRSFLYPLIPRFIMIQNYIDLFIHFLDNFELYLAFATYKSVIGGLESGRMFFTLLYAAFCFQTGKIIGILIRQPQRNNNNHQ